MMICFNEVDYSIIENKSDLEMIEHIEFSNRVIKLLACELLEYGFEMTNIAIDYNNDSKIEYIILRNEKNPNQVINIHTNGLVVVSNAPYWGVISAARKVLNSKNGSKMWWF